MSYLLKVRIGRVVCRDTESLSEYDHFALSGATIVDGNITTFAMEDVAMNERIAAVYEKPVIFDGFSEGREIGLVLFGVDIDNNDEWVEHREDIEKGSEGVAEVVEYVPVIGEYAAKVLKHWPKVVDVFVKLDEDDVLVNHSTAVMLPEVSPFVGKPSVHRLTVRSVREDPTGYSDWDYSIPITFEYQNLDIPSFGEGAVESIRPHAGSELSEWLGSWISGSVDVHIGMSATALNAVDVTVKETVDGADSTVETTGVGISRVYIESLFVPIDEGLEFTRVVIERPNDNGSRVVEPFDPATLSTSARFIGGGFASSGRWDRESDAVVVAGRQGGPVGRPDGEPSLSVEGVANPGWLGRVIVAPPDREQSGADMLQLNHDAVLEIYEVRLNGAPSPMRWLHYVRPASAYVVAQGTVVEEWLRPRVV